VHAGACGGHHDIPTTVVDRPQVFATLTAPSFGPVHSSGSRPGLPGSACRPADGDKTHCPHGNPLWCDAIHRQDDTSVGQPLCPDCYDYAGHVLFNWHAPELWRRFTIALRRAVTRHLRNTGANVELARVSFVNAAEYQRRAIIHYHTLIRLDPSDHDGNSPTEEPEPMAIELAGLVRAAAHQVRVRIETPATSTTLASEVRMLRFGDQSTPKP
jgi:hypothetical protein